MRLAYLLLVQKLEKEMSNSSNECCEVEDRTPTKVKFCNLFCHMFVESLLPNLAANFVFSSRQKLKAKAVRSATTG